MIKILLLATFARAFCAANGLACTPFDAFTFTLAYPEEYAGGVSATHDDIRLTAYCSSHPTIRGLVPVLWGEYEGEGGFTYSVYICKKTEPTS